MRRFLSLSFAFVYFLTNTALAHAPKAKAIVIHILDVHQHLEAQEHISRTIQELMNRKVVDLVALEGAFEPIDLSRLRAFPDRDTIRRVADHLLRTNKISGPVHAALTCPSDIPPFVGIDDPFHHRANVDAYVRTAHRRPSDKKALASLRKRLEEEQLIPALKALRLTEKLVDFSLSSKEWSEYKGGTQFAPYESFYREAILRDRLMAENLLKRLKEREAGTPPVAVLVTGGFHSRGISEYLSKAGVTVIPFAPKLTKIDISRGAAYLSSFSQETTPLEELSEGRTLFVAPHPAEGIRTQEAGLAAAALQAWKDKSPGRVSEYLLSLAPNLADRVKSFAEIERNGVSLHLLMSKGARKARKIVIQIQLTPAGEIIQFVQGEARSLKHRALDRMSPWWTRDRSEDGGIGDVAQSQASLLTAGIHREDILVQEGRTHPLTLDVGELKDKKPALLKRWERIAGGPLYFTQQVNSLSSRPTFVGVASDDCDLGREFTRALVFIGPFWKEMLESDHLFVIRNGSVSVWIGREGWAAPAIARKADRLLDKARITLERIARLRRLRAGHAARLEGVPFFSDVLWRPGDSDFFVSAEIGGGRFLACRGEMEHRELAGLLEDLKQDHADELAALGHVFVSINKKDGVTITSERNDLQAQQAKRRLKKAIEGFCTVVVLSDTHIGSSYKFGDRKAKRLMKLLDRAAKNKALVIINGDFLDLWQNRKYGNITKMHPELFEKLRELRRLIYVVGNHDDEVHRDVFALTRDEALRKAAETASRKDLLRSKRRFWGAESELQALLKHPGLEERRKRLLQGNRVHAADMKTMHVVYDPLKRIFYVDEHILGTLPEADPKERAGRLYDALEDSLRRLDNVIINDLGHTVIVDGEARKSCEIVRYYWDINRGLYLEHGHVADHLSGRNPLSRHVNRLIGILSMKVASLELGIAKVLLRLKVIRDRVSPGSHTKIIGHYANRTIGIAGLMMWMEKELGFPPTEKLIGFGHTHIWVSPGEGPVNAFLEHFAKQTAYINSGGWAAKKEEEEETKERPSIARGNGAFAPFDSATMTEGAREDVLILTVRGERHHFYGTAYQGMVADDESAQEILENLSQQPLEPFH
ncbi:MAG: hypothetical protein HY548_03090, partial [Elusimicrobia bacterium]|nr:hypothetical protein [Elusimicrobiota bacterium]